MSQQPSDGPQAFDWDAPPPNTVSDQLQWLADCFMAEAKIHNPVQLNEWKLEKARAIADMSDALIAAKKVTDDNTTRS